MARDWQFAVQETVGTNRYVPLPPEVRQVVEVDHPLDGPSVYWNYERHSKFVVLSERSLRESNYVDVGRYSVYDADADRARVRPPDALNEVVASRFTAEARVVYLAYEEMTTGENRTVYLLSTGQLLDLLPEDIERRPGEGFTETLLRTPGFLPSP